LPELNDDNMFDVAVNEAAAAAVAGMSMDGDDPLGLAIEGDEIVASQDLPGELSPEDERARAKVLRGYDHRQYAAQVRHA